MSRLAALAPRPLESPTTTSPTDRRERAGLDPRLEAAAGEVEALAAGLDLGSAEPPLDGLFGAGLGGPAGSPFTFGGGLGLEPPLGEGAGDDGFGFEVGGDTGPARGPNASGLAMDGAGGVTFGIDGNGDFTFGVWGAKHNDGSDAKDSGRESIGLSGAWGAISTSGNVSGGGISPPTKPEDPVEAGGGGSAEAAPKSDPPAENTPTGTKPEGSSGTQGTSGSGGTQGSGGSSGTQGTSGSSGNSTDVCTDEDPDGDGKPGTADAEGGAEMPAPDGVGASRETLAAYAAAHGIAPGQVRPSQGPKSNPDPNAEPPGDAPPPAPSVPEELVHRLDPAPSGRSSLKAGRLAARIAGGRVGPEVVNPNPEAEPRPAGEVPPRRPGGLF